MDTAESAERAHSPALPPPLSLCPPSAQPGYLSAGIHSLSVPAARGARGPPDLGSSPRTLHLSPRPVPAALARAQCPCSVLVVCCGRAHVLYARFALAILQVRGLLETLASNPRREREAGGAPCCRRVAQWPWSDGSPRKAFSVPTPCQTVLAQVQVLRLLISRSRDSPEKLPNSSYDFVL